MRKIKEDSLYYPIPIIPGYTINYQGYIKDPDGTPVERYLSENKVFVRINNIGYSVDALVWKTFIGYTTYPIFHFDENPLNTSANNLYVYASPKYLYGDFFEINDVIFKRIPLCPKYVIDRDGTVFGLVRGRFLVRAFNDKGYPTISIPDVNDFRSPRKVHRMVYLTFIGELDPSLIVDHIDGNILNPCANNLRQIPISENVSRIFDYRGKTHRAKSRKYHIAHDFEVDNNDIKIICAALQKNMYPEDILKALNRPIEMRNYGAFIKLLTSIRQKRVYQDISADYEISQKPRYNYKDDNRSPIFSPMDKTFIGYQLSVKRTWASIADLYGCSYSSFRFLTKDRDKNRSKDNQQPIPSDREGSTTIERVA